MPAPHFIQVPLSMDSASLDAVTQTLALMFFGHRAYVDSSDPISKTYSELEAVGSAWKAQKRWKAPEYADALVRAW